MRKFMWFTLGFGAACGVGTYTAPGWWALAAALAALLACGLLLFLARRAKGFRVGLCVCLGLSLGFSWFWTYDALFLSPARQADGETREIALTVRDYPRESAYGYSVDGVISLSGRRYKVRLYASGIQPEPGDTVHVSAQLRLTADGGSQQPTYHRSNGIFLLAYARGEAQVVPGQAGLAEWPANVRWTLNRRISDLFPADTAAFAQALLLGERSGLTYREENAMSLSGISHVVAVSGMHLVILFALVYALTFRHRVISAVIGIPVLFLFSAVAGFTPSVTRSAVMLTLALIAGLVRREYDPPTALAFAALCLLTANPLTAASASFQLSVAAVAGILCFSGRLYRWLTRRVKKGKGWMQRCQRAAANSVAVTLSATAFTAPIVACTFGVMSLVSPVTNLLTLWAVSLAFYGEIAACVLSYLWMPLGRIVAWVVAWLIRYILAVSNFLGELPFAAVFPAESPYLAAWVWFAVLMLGMFALCRFRGKKVFGLGLGAALLLSVALGLAEPLGNRFLVRVLDVGQGQCVVLQAGGKTYVVDCGGDGEDAGEKAARHLQSWGVFHIDGLILTHFDQDHVSGAAHLLDRIPVDRLYLPPSGDEACQTLAAQGGSRTVLVEEDLQLTWDDAVLHIFAPLQQRNGNDSGVSVLFTAGEYDTLITGDMSRQTERLLLETHSLPDIELLVAGHHGAETSTGLPLLRVTRPEVVAISVGDNAYGHPAEQTLARIAGEGCRILRTDQSGTLIFRG